MAGGQGMMINTLRSILSAVAILSVGACGSEPVSEPTKSPTENAQAEALHQIELKAPAPFQCLLGLREFGADLDTTSLKPAKAYVDYHRARLMDILGDEPLDVWMPHWKSISLSKANIDAQVEANWTEYSKLLSDNRTARGRSTVLRCVRPALLAGVGPKVEVEKARASKAADDADYEKIAKAASAQ